jgi:hypothetical protein
VDVRVPDRLTSGRAIVYPNRVTVWLKFLRHARANLGNQLPQAGELFGGQFKDTGDVAPGNDQSMPIAYGESVWKRDRPFVLNHGLVHRALTEWAVSQHRHVQLNREPGNTYEL